MARRASNHPACAKSRAGKKKSKSACHEDTGAGIHSKNMFWKEHFQRKAIDEESARRAVDALLSEPPQPSSPQLNHDSAPADTGSDNVDQLSAHKCSDEPITEPHLSNDSAPVCTCSDQVAQPSLQQLSDDAHDSTPIQQHTEEDITIDDISTCDVSTPAPAQAIPQPPPQPLTEPLKQCRKRARSSSNMCGTKGKTKINPPGVVIPDVEVMRRSLNRAASDMNIDDQPGPDIAPHKPDTLRHLMDQWAYDAVKRLMEYYDVPGDPYSKTLDWLIVTLNSLVVSTCFSGCDAPGTSILEIERAVRQHYAEAEAEGRAPPTKLGAVASQCAYHIEWDPGAQVELFHHPYASNQTCLFSDINGFWKDTVQEVSKKLRKGFFY